MQARPLCAPAASLGQRVVPEEQEAKGSSGLLQFSLWRCSLCTPAALGCADCSYPTCPGAAGLTGLWWLCSVGWGVQHEEQALCSAWARSPPTIQNGAAPHHLHRGLHLASTSIVLQFSFELKRDAPPVPCVVCTLLPGSCCAQTLRLTRSCGTVCECHPGLQVTPQSPGSTALRSHLAPSHCAPCPAAALLHPCWVLRLPQLSSPGLVGSCSGEAQPGGHPESMGLLPPSLGSSTGGTEGCPVVWSVGRASRTWS